jgi:hypothetical protein
LVFWSFGKSPLLIISILPAHIFIVQFIVAYPQRLKKEDDAIVEAIEAFWDDVNKINIMGNVIH